MAAKKTNFTVVRMGRLLAVSRSGYYAWRGRAISDRALRQESIERKIAGVRDDSDGAYGALRILADLRGDGEIISRKTVAITMRRLGLVGVSPRTWTTTVIDQTDAYPVDEVKRQGDTGELNRVWAGDPTYLTTWEEWIYLATP